VDVFALEAHGQDAEYLANDDVHIPDSEAVVLEHEREEEHVERGQGVHS